MAKKKQPFIKKKLRPSPEIDPDKKIGDLTVRELSSILGFEEKSAAGKNSEGLIGSVLKRILDKSYKDYKDNKDLIYEGPLRLQSILNQKQDYYEKDPSENPEQRNLSGLLEEIIKKISGLENEIKNLKEKKK